jgi:hypothetical protein
MAHPDHHDVELVRVSEREWRVCDCSSGFETIGFVEYCVDGFEALLIDAPSWRPHFSSLENAVDYFEEYLEALELGVS